MKKVILVTGASSGIGLASAKKLREEGHIVYGSSWKDSGTKTLKEIGAIPVQIEMTDEASMKAVVDQIIKEQGRIDVLFNNAGYGHYGPVEELSVDVGRRTMEINVFGLARLTQLVLPHMRKQGGGRIINTSSIGGKIYLPLGGWYHASKHALEGLTDCLRLEVAPLGIDVVLIEPGIIDTGFNERMVGRIAEIDRTGAYTELEDAMLQAGDSDDRGSSPDVIAELVSKAVNATRPKTRYHGGQLATLVLFARRYFSDRLFDRFIMMRINQRIKKMKK